MSDQKQQSDADVFGETNRELWWHKWRKEPTNVSTQLCKPSDPSRLSTSVPLQPNRRSAYLTVSRHVRKGHLRPQAQWLALVPEVCACSVYVLCDLRSVLCAVCAVRVYAVCTVLPASSRRTHWYRNMNTLATHVSSFWLTTAASSRKVCQTAASMN